MIPDPNIIDSNAVITATQYLTAWQLANIKEDTMLGKLIGPSMEYVGERIPIIIDKSIKKVPKTTINILRILGHAIHISGSKCDNYGVVNPRVLRQIFDEGAFCEDELTSMYFGGILASSRNADFKDDRALNYLSLLSSMSSYQMRVHYMIYTILRKAYAGKNIDFESNWIEDMQIFVPLDEFFSYMRKSPEDRSKNDLLFVHLFWGLKRLGLISDFGYGDRYVVSKRYPGADDQGVVILPSLFGIELYMWVNGLSDVSPFCFINENIQFANLDYLDMPAGAKTFSHRYKFNL
jgi:hypothetical protein